MTRRLPRTVWYAWTDTETGPAVVDTCTSDFDTVLADYLLGAVEGFAPYWQGQLFGRLRPLVAKRLYVIGLQPYIHGRPDTAAGRIVNAGKGDTNLGAPNLTDREARPHTSFLKDVVPLPGRNVVFGVRAFF